MADHPAPDRLAKLPAWAQEYIKDLRRERDIAVRDLNEWCDDQTVSPVSIRENTCIGEAQGPTSKTRYIQTRRLAIDHADVHLEITIYDEGQGMRGQPGIELQWSRAENRLGGGDVAFIPSSYQCARLVSAANLRVR